MKREPQGSRVGYEMTDAHTETCVLHPNVARAGKSDFCLECLNEGMDEDNFGRCYICRDFHDHANCIGVPCQCSCPRADELEREVLRRRALAKLTSEERLALGV